MAEMGHLLWGRGSADTMEMIYEFQEGPPQSSNTTQALIHSLIFSKNQSLRASTIILGSFNLFAAFLTALSILYDCYWPSRGTTGGLKAKKFCLSAIHPAETFPLVLSLGIVVQGLIFVAAQSTGMSSIFIERCSVISQFVFPAIFIVPYIQIVFGLECAIRSLRKGGFPARGKYDVSICLALIVVMLLVTSIPTHITPENDFCFASLVWFATKYQQLGLALLAACGGLAIISATVIFCRLMTLKTIDQKQRIAASRIVYYLVLAVVSLAFVIPWFATLTMAHPTVVTSMMATVVLNLHGLMTCLLQIFLRANTATTAFRPKDTPGWSLGRREIRLWGRNELGFDGHILKPVSGPRSPGSIGSRSSLIENEKARERSLDSIRSLGKAESSGTLNKPFRKAAEELPDMVSIIRPEAAVLKRTSTSDHKRKQSYGLFPPNPVAVNPSQQQDSQSVLKIPQSRIKDKMAEIFRPSSFQQQRVEPTLDAGGFLAPPSLFGGNSSRHRRDSSIQTSVTVEIGLRLSHAPTELQYPSPPRSRRASPLLRLQTNLSPIISRSPLAPSSLKTDAVRSSLSAEQRAARMKTLPPIPRHSTMSEMSGAAEPMIKLSPTVYTPQGIKRSATTGMTPPPRPTDLSPLWARKTEEDSRPRGSKASWI